jgi:excisionase family DNA binding protein
VTEPALKPLRSVCEVAAYLGKSVPTVYRLIRSRKLRASKVGGEWRISDKALRDFLEDGINF